MTYTTPPFDAAVAFDGTRHRSLMDILVPAVGGKWVVFVVRALSGSPLCFNQLRRLTIGVSQRKLALTIKGMEQGGLVTRTTSVMLPPRVDFGLTVLGRSLVGPLVALYDWAVEHQAAVQAARARSPTREPRATSPKEDRSAANAVCSITRPRSWL